MKIQVEFNPKQVAEYRLIGYETRALNREDFTNDQVDAGEIGSGHAVTAIYEITPAGSPGTLLEPLRYSGETAAPNDGRAGEIAFLRLRYKLPGEAASRLIERPITAKDGYSAIAQAPAETRFAVAVAAFGQLLRGDPYLKAFGYDEVIALAQPARGEDPVRLSQRVHPARTAGRRHAGCDDGVICRRGVRHVGATARQIAKRSCRGRPAILLHKYRGVIQRPSMTTSRATAGRPYKVHCLYLGRFALRSILRPTSGGSGRREWTAWIFSKAFSVCSGQFVTLRLFRSTQRISHSSVAAR